MNSDSEKFSYQTLLEENVEYKKIITKLENLLTKERSEKLSLQKIHEEFKNLHEKTRKELLDMNNKLVNIYNEKSTLEKKNEQDLLRQKNYFNKEKDVYEAQILKLSAIDVESIKF